MMDESILTRKIELEVIRQLIAQNKYFVPAAISGRHIHVCTEDLEMLFGKGHTLTKIRSLVQPGQFACEEQLTLMGPKGKIEKIRVLGPVRKETQVELSFTDSRKLGIEALVRMSGDLAGSAGGRLIGPAGEVTLAKGVIISARHLHMSAEEALWFGLKDNDVVQVRKSGTREIVFGNVAVRAGEGHALQMHIDTDEANAAGMACGELLQLLR